MVLYTYMGTTFFNNITDRDNYSTAIQTDASAVAAENKTFTNVTDDSGNPGVQFEVHFSNATDRDTAYTNRDTDWTNLTIAGSSENKHLHYHDETPVKPCVIEVSRSK